MDPVAVSQPQATLSDSFLFASEQTAVKPAVVMSGECLLFSLKGASRSFGLCYCCCSLIQFKLRIIYLLHNCINKLFSEREGKKKSLRTVFEAREHFWKHLFIYLVCLGMKIKKKAEFSLLNQDFFSKNYLICITICKLTSFGEWFFFFFFCTPRPNAAGFPDLHIDLRLRVSGLIKCEWRGSSVILSAGVKAKWSDCLSCYNSNQCKITREYLSSRGKWMGWSVMCRQIKQLL